MKNRFESERKAEKTLPSGTFYAMINVRYHVVFEKDLSVFTAKHRCLSGNYGFGLMAVAKANALARH